MEVAALVIGAVGGIGGIASLGAMFVLWGTYKEKVNRLERDVGARADRDAVVRLEREVENISRRLEAQRTAELESLRRKA
jgi:hypothetical protein